MSSRFSLTNDQRGAVSGMLVAVIGLSVLVLGVGSFAIWSYVAYQDAQSNVDDRITIKVQQAKEDQANEDEAKYAELRKLPGNKYQAPDDYCGLTFTYPETWSRYDSEQITNGGDFKSYLNPELVPPLSNSSQYALRVVIEQKDFDSVLSIYQGRVTAGKLVSSTGSSNSQPYTRYDGDFSNNIRGHAVIYRCRDKTITIQTDTKDTFKSDFDSIIRTVNFNT